MRILKILLIILLLFVVPFVASASYPHNKTVYNSNVCNEKVIALTFDDGPHPRLTNQILDVLDEYDIKATFFVIGVNVDNYHKPLTRAIEEGHEIGNHTNSHSILKSMETKKIQEEIDLCRRKIFNLTGYNANLIRPPCGLYDEKLINVAKKKNDKIILWNIDTHDWAHMPTEDMVSNVVTNVKGGDIILFHDYISGESNTVEALKRLIPILKAKGYEFVTVSQLLQK